MAVDQLARSSTEELRSRCACSDAVAQLLHFAAHRFFAECSFVEVRPPFDVAVPLRADLLRRDFRIHHRKGCGYLALQVNVDASVRGRGDDHETIRSVAAGVAPLIRDWRSNHIRRASSDRSFSFRPRPSHHAAAPGIARAAQPTRRRRELPGVDARPPRGVTVFAERWDESGAARPQKRRRHFPPSHPRVSRGQAPRRRPGADDLRPLRSASAKIAAYRFAKSSDEAARRGFAVTS